MPRNIQLESETTIGILRINAASQRANLGSFVIAVLNCLNPSAIHLAARLLDSGHNSWQHKHFQPVHDGKQGLIFPLRARMIGR